MSACDILLSFISEASRPLRGFDRLTLPWAAAFVRVRSPSSSLDRKYIACYFRVEHQRCNETICNLYVKIDLLRTDLARTFSPRPSTAAPVDLVTFVILRLSMAITSQAFTASQRYACDLRVKSLPEVFILYHGHIESQVSHDCLSAFGFFASSSLSRLASLANICP
jgi:hypothetical protein